MTFFVCAIKFAFLADLALGPLELALKMYQVTSEKSALRDLNLDPAAYQD